jgi:hypothetical protein
MREVVPRVLERPVDWGEVHCGDVGVARDPARNIQGDDAPPDHGGRRRWRRRRRRRRRTLALVAAAAFAGLRASPYLPPTVSTTMDGAGIMVRRGRRRHLRFRVEMDRHDDDDNDDDNDIVEIIVPARMAVSSSSSSSFPGQGRVVLGDRRPRQRQGGRLPRGHDGPGGVRSHRRVDSQSVACLRGRWRLSMRRQQIGSSSWEAVGARRLRRRKRR